MAKGRVAAVGNDHGGVGNACLIWNSRGSPPRSPAICARSKRRRLKSVRQTLDAFSTARLCLARFVSNLLMLLQID